MENVTNLTHRPIKISEGVIIPANGTVTIDLPTNRHVTQLLRMGLIKSTPAHEDVVQFSAADAEAQSKAADARKARALQRRQEQIAAEATSTKSMKTKAAPKRQSSNSK